jgi:N-acetyl-gamma-glutamyl-phosphate/LysW-gamma-L-alpha-aminoadipyl-6-phosphate reductase
MNNSKLTVSVLGGSGYVGGELLRLLLFHPNLRLQQVTSRNFAGLPVSILHPNLRGLTDLKFCSPDSLLPCDLLILALPNGDSMKTIDKWMGLADRIIDLGADFRFQKAEDWEFWYGYPHAAPELLGKFVYGVPEIFREQIRSAKYVAGPGCEAITSILCLYPFVKNKMIKNFPIIIDAKMSSSQAGSKASWSSHHPERAGAVRSYKPTNHRHTGEIEQLLKAFNPEISVCVSATAIEMIRGILVTIHTFLNSPSSDRDIWKILRQEYKDEPFIRLVKMNQGLYRFPEPKVVLGTNLCDIGFEIEERTSRLVIIGAIDNLVKGAAGNAVQCLNIMAGFPETAGLERCGLHPI